MGDLELSSYSDVYNLAAASYDSKSFSVSAQASTNPQAMDFSADGTKMYILEAMQTRLFFNTVYQLLLMFLLLVTTL